MPRRCAQDRRGDAVTLASDPYSSPSSSCPPGVPPQPPTRQARGRDATGGEGTARTGTGAREPARTPGDRAGSVLLFTSRSGAGRGAVECGRAAARRRRARGMHEWGGADAIHHRPAPRGGAAAGDGVATRAETLPGRRALPGMHESVPACFCDRVAGAGERDPANPFDRAGAEHGVSCLHHQSRARCRASQR